MTTRITKNQFTGGIAATAESTITSGSLTLDGGRNIQWGGAYGSGYPAVWGHASNKLLRFAPDGSTTGIVVEMANTGVDVTGDLTVSGDFTVSGTTTTVNTDNLLIEDLNITLANGSANSFVADGAGITIDGANATFIYEHGGGQSRFETNNGLYVTGSSTNSIAVLKATRSNASGSNNTYTLEVDSSAHTSNLTSAGAMAVDVNSGRAFTINGFGNVGIGTDTPERTLHVETTSGIPARFSRTSAYNYDLKIDNLVTGDAIDYVLEPDQASSGYMWRTRNSSNNNVTALSINSNGNVGVGTTDPAAPLNVYTGNAGVAYFDAGTNPYVYIRNATAAAAETATLGFAPANNVDGAQIQVIAEADFASTANRSAAMSLRTRYQGTHYDRLYIKANGDVGIGETAPDTTLHIKKNQSAAASSIKLENSAGGDNSSFDIDWQLASSGTSARIRAVRTNSPGAGDTNLVFSTSDNGTSVDDRLVINNLGRVLVGSGSHTADGITIGAVNGNSELDLAHPTAKRWRILSASTGDFYLQNKTDSYNSLIVTGTSSTGYLVSQFATQVRLVLGSSGAYNNNTSNWIRGNSDYLQYNSAGSGHTWEIIGAEKMRLDSDGLGIGTNSPSTKLEVASSTMGDNFIRLTGQAGSGTNYGVTLAKIQAKWIGDDNWASINFEDERTSGTGTHKSGISFTTRSGNNAGTEKMRLNNSGNLLVGKTSDVDAGVGVRVRGDGLVQATRSNADPLSVNRTNSDGMVVAIRKNQGLVGSIGITATDNLVIHSTASGHYGLEFGSLGIAPTANTGSSVDNVVDLGHSTKRFDDIYATNGTIQTSDVNEKQQIATLTDAEITAAKSISKLFKTFKWNDSVAEKGDDARTHTGVIAQQVETAMTDAGLNASDYAFFISTTWWEIQTEVPEVEAVEEVLDENGNVSVEAVEYQEAYTRYDTYETAEEAPEGAVERNRKGIRYPELLSFIGAATEQRLSSIESRLDALEAS